MLSLEHPPVANDTPETLTNAFLEDHADVIESEGFSMETVKDVCSIYFRDPDMAAEAVQRNTDPRAAEILRFIVQMVSGGKPPSPSAPGMVLPHVDLGTAKPANDNADEEQMGKMAA